MSSEKDTGILTEAFVIIVVGGLLVLLSASYSAIKWLIKLIIKNKKR